MNVLITFPTLDKFSKIEEGRQKAAIQHLDNLIDKLVNNHHKIYFLAEDSMARALQEDVPKANYIRLTSEYDDDLVAMYESTQLYAIPKALTTVDYSDAPIDVDVSTEDKFYTYLKSCLQRGYTKLQTNMQLIVEFSMPKKDMTVFSASIPQGAFYYKYDVLRMVSSFYAGGKECSVSINDVIKGGS